MATRIGQPGSTSSCCFQVLLSNSKTTALTVLFLLVCSVYSKSDNTSNRRTTSGFNSKDPDVEKLSQLFKIESDGYFTDTEQVPVRPFSGVSIQNEAQKLSANLRWISNEEIGVTPMQVSHTGLQNKIPSVRMEKNEKAWLSDY